MDISVPTSPQLDHTVTLGDVSFGRGLTLAGGLVFVAADVDGLRIYEAGTTDPPVVIPTIGAAFDVAVGSGFACLADDPATVTIVDW